MARLVCPEHGEVKKVSHSGYSLGHSTSRNGPNELDLEGIEFTFKVNEITENSLDLELVDSDNAEDYLSKFADWREEVTNAAENQPEQKCGHDSCAETSASSIFDQLEQNGHDNCNELLYWLGDDEESPM